jgi:DUF4097 and DUF4098 domain-containing protein YvlB
MRKTVLMVVALLILGPAAAPAAGREASQRGRGGDRVEEVERLSKTVKIGATGEIDVVNFAGDIVVTRGGGSEAKIEMVKTARARTAQEAREMLPLVQIEVAERPGRVELRTRYPRDEPMMRGHRNVSVTVAYTIAAPPAARITLKTMSGNIRVSDIVGDLALEAVSGNVRVSGAARINVAKTLSGNVEIADTRSEAALDAGSVSGSVILNRVKARRMDLGTVSGNVMLSEVDCDRVDAHSTSGDIEFGGQLGKSGRYGLRSHSGNVRLVLAGSTGFEVEATTFSGTIRSDLPLTGQTPEARGGRGPGRLPGQALRGLFGDGSAVVELRTFSGSIVITKR